MSRFSNSFIGSVAASHDYHFSRQVDLTEGNISCTTHAVLHKIVTETRGDNRVSTRLCRFTKLESIRHDIAVTIDGEEWSIDSVHTQDVTGVLCTLIRTVVNEAARERYRK